MIDIISSSIRLGKTLRDIGTYASIYEFYKAQTNDSGIPACTYRDLLNKYFSKYGFYSFDYVDRVIEQNLTSEEDIAKRLAQSIRTHVDNQSNYPNIIKISKEVGAVLEKYIDELFTSTPDFPVLNVANKAMKVQQISNELSTAILRTGLFSSVANPLLVATVKKDPLFAGQYEKQTEEYRKKMPYSKEIRKIIGTLDKGHKCIAEMVEGIYFIKHLVRNGIMQGFFFELYDLSEDQILAYKESHRDQSIHPIVIKTNMVFPSSQLMLFRYTLNGRTSYLLAKRMVIHFSPEECNSKISGYCYPTNEYRLFLENR